MKEPDFTKQWFEAAMYGNVSGFNNILTFYHAQLYAYALKICKKSDDAGEALQDACINMFLHFREIREPDHLLNWMLTIVKRSCWQQLSYGKTDVLFPAKINELKMVDDSLEKELENNDMNAFLWERISKLSEPLRVVVILRYFSVFNDYEYISKLLGIPVGTVRSRLNEAKKQLKKIWDSNLSEMPDKIRKDAEYWNDFYSRAYFEMQTDMNIRKDFTNHLIPGLTIRFSNGELKQGRRIMEKEIADDIRFGTSYKLNAVFNLNGIGIVQGENINSAEYPDRCPPLTTLIFYRTGDKSHHINFHVS